jgi:hypothetical protein
MRVHFFEYWRHVRKTASGMPDIFDGSAQSEVNQLAREARTRLNKVLRLDISMYNFKGLKIGKEFGEVKGKVDNFLYGKVIGFVPDESLE